MGGLGTSVGTDKKNDATAAASKAAEKDNSIGNLHQDDKNIKLNKQDTLLTMAAGKAAGAAAGSEGLAAVSAGAVELAIGAGAVEPVD